VPVSPWLDFDEQVVIKGCPQPKPTVVNERIHLRNEALIDG